MNRTRLAVVGLVIGAFAAMALGQNADKNSAGPTRNDYRLKVVEPAEGATITGPTVRVIVNTMVTEQIGDSEKRDVNSMPRPDVDVFVDGTLKGTMRDESNVLEVESVPVGAHKLVLVAKNRANEIIDRKEINFSSVEAVASTATTTTAETSRSVAVAPPPPPPPAPAPAPVTSARSYEPPPSPPGTSAEQPLPPRPRMPATASLDPALVIAGAGMLFLALLIRRLLARRRRFVA